MVPGAIGLRFAWGSARPQRAPSALDKAQGMVVKPLSLPQPHPRASGVHSLVVPRSGLRLLVENVVPNKVGPGDHKCSLPYT